MVVEDTTTGVTVADLDMTITTVANMGRPDAIAMILAPEELTATLALVMIATVAEAMTDVVEVVVTEGMTTALDTGEKKLETPTAVAAITRTVNIDIAVR